MIPYPHAAGGHQKPNAEVLSCRGCALVLDQNAQLVLRLSEMIRDLIQAPQRLQSMMQNFDKFPVPANDAAKKLAELVLGKI